ncbi:Son of sevenless [Melia azedarach]|uniref:Son of sevenless n=1 Tax=Melia azedarach TaxID=155640 RepID=A0ACC1XKY7_MELAZ|nr:Son of sevenless [Melia azedarach]
MESPSVASPRISSDHSKMGGSEDTHLHDLELESSDSGNDYSVHQFHSTSALEILRESVRILRFNASAFMITAAVLICPVSAVFLSNLFVHQSIVRKFAFRLLLVAEASGLPLRPFIKQAFHKFSELALSSAVCFPLFITLSLLSKAAVVYSVDRTYKRKQVDISKFFVIVHKIWKRVLLTYFWMCMVIVGCLTLLFVLLFAVSSALSAFWSSPELVLYAVIIVGFVFSVVYATAVVICNLGIVISVLEDVSGPQALHRSGVLIKGQTQVGLLIFLISTIGMAFTEGLFDHRVKTLSYGDGSSRIWEGPLLVIMYSFVVLIDSMMNAVFCLSCKSYSMGALDGESEPILETVAVSDESVGG